MKIRKNQFIKGYLATILILALVRVCFGFSIKQEDNADKDSGEIVADSTLTAEPAEESLPVQVSSARLDISKMPHRINSVASYRLCFPDTNAVQLEAAKQWGIKRVKNRADAEERKRELVYIGASPYFHVDRLSNSIPYLVPRAAILLHDIGKAFYDSLYVKGVPLNQIIVTSVLRTQEDVERLRRRNSNATENSCHLYGTTFDICYNRYQPISRPVSNDTLKWVLSEVLRDMRQQERCYIKYEVKQGCFHMTVR